MAGVKGRSGTNKGKDKAFSDAVRLVINEHDEVRGKRKLRCLAEKLYEEAMNGEGWAMCQIADRLEGKPAQEATVTFEHSELDGMSDAELRAFIAREVARIGDPGHEAAEQPNSGKPH